MAVSVAKPILGNTTSINLRKPDLTQTDPKKGDYVRGKEEFLEQVSSGSGGSVSPEQVKAAVEEYLAENPIEAPSNGGYYSPEVSLVDGNALAFNFIASDESMPAMPTQIVNIPGADLSGYIPVPATAAVGQFIVVAAVDENGVVTATEAVDMEILEDAEGVAF